MGYDWKGWSVLFYVFSGLLLAIGAASPQELGLTAVQFKWATILLGVGVGVFGKMGASWAGKTDGAQAAAVKAILPFVLATTLALTACAPPPTVQTEPGKRAWQAGQVLQRVEELQETAIQAEASGGLPTAQARVIVRFTVAAAETCRTYPQGWEATLATAFKATKAHLPASVLQKSEVAFGLGVLEGIIRSLNGGCAVSPLLIALLQNVVIPEIIVAIKAHHNATGNYPTETEVLAAVDTTAARITARGTAWLAAHPE